MIASEGGSTEPYVAIRATAEVHKDPETKRMLWGPHLKKFIKDPENPKYVAIRFIHRGSSIIAEARWKFGSATKRNESMAIVIIEAPRPPEKWGDPD
jgi:general stress protein 26